MSLGSGPVDPPGQISVERNPTPDAEGGFFSSADEKRQEMRNKHDLALLDRNLGAIGKYTGSTNSSLNIAAAIAAGLILALFLCLAGATIQGIKDIGPYIEKLISAILAVGGFIFGVRQGGSDKNS